MILSELPGLLREVGVKVFHHEVTGNHSAHIVWGEYRENSFRADNTATEAAFWRVQVEYSTDNRRDPNAAKLRKLLADNHIPFTHEIIYDRHARRVRHIFDCEVMGDGI